MSWLQGETSAGGIEAPLELGEGARVVGGREAELELIFTAEAGVVLVFPHLGFGGAPAAVGPLAVDELVDEEAGFGGGGAGGELGIALVGFYLAESGHGLDPG